MPQARIDELTSRRAGSFLSSQALAGNTMLQLETGVDFDFRGGRLIIGEDIYTYSNLTQDPAVLDISPSVVSTYPLGTEVNLYPISVEKWAVCRLGDATYVDAILARVPYSTAAQLSADGVREPGKGEQVNIELDAYGNYVVTEVYGRQPLIDSNNVSVDPDNPAGWVVPQSEIDAINTAVDAAQTAADNAMTVGLGAQTAANLAAASAEDALLMANANTAFASAAWETYQTNLVSQVDAASSNSIANVYFQTTPPLGLGPSDAGDFWFDTNDTDHVYHWDGSAWVSNTDQSLASQAQLAGVDSVYDGKSIKIFFNPSQVTSVHAGDLWSDTDDFVIYRAMVASADQISATEWVNISDQRIAAASTAAATAQTAADAAMTAAEAAQATADGAITTYYSADPPWANGSTQPSSKVGDLWFDTDTNQAYRWNGTSWVLIEDNQIAAALAAAESAQTTADGKITAYYQTTQPTVAEHADLGVGDLWYDTDDGNKPYYCSSMSPVTFTAIRDATIATAQSTADSKNRTFLTGTAPSSPQTGDIWIDSSNGNILKRWNGTSWQTAQDAAIAAAQGSATTAQTMAALAAQQGYNRVYNGNFALGMDGWDSATTGGSGGGASVVTTTHAQGAQALQLVGPSGTGPLYASATQNVARYFPVAGDLAGQVYFKYTVYNANGNTGQQFVPRVVWYDATKTYLGYTDAPWYNNFETIVPNGTQKVLDNALVVPTNARFASVQFNYNSGSTSGTMYVLEAFISDLLLAGMIAANQITGDKIAAKTITADKVVIGDTNNLWPYQYAELGWEYGISTPPWSKDTEAGTPPAGGNSFLVGGRDQIYPFSSWHTPALAGDQFVVDWTCKQIGSGDAGHTNTNAGSLYLWWAAADGDTTNGWQHTSVSTVDTDLGGGWHRYRHVIQCSPSQLINGSKPVKYACISFSNDDRYGYDANSRCAITDISVRRMDGVDLIVSGGIQADMLAANSVTAGKIAAGAVTAGKIAADSVTSAEIAAGTIQAGDIAAGAITTDRLAANAVTTDRLAANAINGMTITGATVQTATSGARVVLDASGLRVYKSDGTVRANFPADDAQNAIVTGTADFDSITARGFNLQSTNNVVNGTLDLSKGVVAPKTSPTPAFRDDAGLNLNLDFSGLAANTVIRGIVEKDATNWAGVTHSYQPGSGSSWLQTWSANKTTGALTYNTAAGDFDILPGIAYLGGKSYVLAIADTGTNRKPSNNSGDLLVWEITTSGTWNLVFDTTLNSSTTAGDVDTASTNDGAVLGTDGTDLYLAYFKVGDTSKVYVDKFTTTGTRTAALYSLNLDSSNNPRHLNYLFVGNADYGSLNIVLGCFVNSISSGQVWQPGTSLNADANKQIAARINAASPYLPWDSSASRFWLGTYAGVLKQCSHFTTKTLVNNTQYTWYDSDTNGGGTHETDPSPGYYTLGSTYVPARQWYQITTPTPADSGGNNDPDSVRIYVGGHLQATTTGTNQTLLESINTGSAAPPGSNGFATVAAPGVIESVGSDSYGPLFQVKGDGTGSWQAVAPTGTIVMYAGSTAPAGWYMCDGTFKNRTTDARLFSVVGTTFGAGDGSTTFNLPDMTNRFPIGVGAYGGTALGGNEGEVGIDPTHIGNRVAYNQHSHAHGASSDGQGSHSHNVNGHTHGIAIVNSNAASGSVARISQLGGVALTVNGSNTGNTNSAGSSTDAQGYHGHNITVNAAGLSNGANEHARLGLNFIIKA